MSWEIDDAGWRERVAAPSRSGVGEPVNAFDAKLCEALKFGPFSGRGHSHADTSRGDESAVTLPPGADATLPPVHEGSTMPPHESAATLPPVDTAATLPPDGALVAGQTLVPGAVEAETPMPADRRRVTLPYMSPDDEDAPAHSSEERGAQEQSAGDEGASAPEPGVPTELDEEADAEMAEHSPAAAAVAMAAAAQSDAEVPEGGADVLDLLPPRRRYATPSPVLPEDDEPAPLPGPSDLPPVPEAESVDPTAEDSMESMSTSDVMGSESEAASVEAAPAPAPTATEEPVAEQATTEDAAAEAEAEAPPTEAGAEAESESDAPSPADSAPRLFIPTSLTTEEEAEGAAEVEADAGVPEQAPRTSTEELDEMEPEELDSDELLEHESGAPPAPPPRAKAEEVEGQPPPAPKKPEGKPERRRRAWYDDAFGDSYKHAMPSGSARAAERDAEFIQDVAGLDEGASILDVGCGDGRHVVALTRLGFEVTGIDSSMSQLLAASQNLATCEVEASVLHGDMRELPDDQSYDGIICLGSTFGYFEDDQNRACLSQMAERLNPGGKLVLQVFNRDHLCQYLPVRSWWQGRGVMVLDEGEMNFFANRLRVHRTMIFEDGRQYEHYYFLRAYTVHDLGKMLSAAGLKVLEVSGSRETRGRFYGGASPHIWIVATPK